jgi:hypothetical protein
MSDNIDYQVRTEAQSDARIYTDAYDEGLWLSIHLNNASVSAVLTREQAIALIDAIQFALSAGDAA